MTWKSIKNLIFQKELPNVAPSNIFDNGRNLTDPIEMANAFNVVTDNQFSIRYSRFFHFRDFFPLFFPLNPTDEIQVKHIMLPLNP